MLKSRRKFFGQAVGVASGLCFCKSTSVAESRKERPTPMLMELHYKIKGGKASAIFRVDDCAYVEEDDGSCIALRFIDTVPLVTWKRWAYQEKQIARLYLTGNPNRYFLLGGSSDFFFEPVVHENMVHGAVFGWSEDKMDNVQRLRKFIKTGTFSST